LFFFFSYLRSFQTKLVAHKYLCDKNEQGYHSQGNNDDDSQISIHQCCDKLKDRTKVFLKREIGNIHDKNAILV